jgi:hypothetical protein
MSDDGRGVAAGEGRCSAVSARISQVVLGPEMGPQTTCGVLAEAGTSLPTGAVFNSHQVALRIL